ncbi:hypothetical protein KCU62_g832, partial [Aureobasidium sp. EXF-3399]
MGRRANQMADDDGESSELDTRSRPSTPRQTGTMGLCATQAPDGKMASTQDALVIVEFSGIKITLTKINKYKASDLAMAAADVDTHPDGLRFVCPVRSCATVFGANCTYEQSTKHTGLHQSVLYSMGWHVCPFGCRSGFADPLQQRQHISSNCSPIPHDPLTRTVQGRTAALRIR